MLGGELATNSEKLAQLGRLAQQPVLRRSNFGPDQLAELAALKAATAPVVNFQHRQ